MAAGTIGPIAARRNNCILKVGWRNGPRRSAFGGIPEAARRTWNLDRRLKYNCQLGFEEEESTLQCASYGHLPTARKP
jgi:hypothetical protein